MLRLHQEPSGGGQGEKEPCPREWGQKGSETLGLDPLCPCPSDPHYLSPYNTPPHPKHSPHQRSLWEPPRRLSSRQEIPRPKLPGSGKLTGQQTRVTADTHTTRGVAVSLGDWEPAGHPVLSIRVQSVCPEPKARQRGHVGKAGRGGSGCFRERHELKTLRGSLHSLQRATRMMLGFTTAPQHTGCSQGKASKRRRPRSPARW